MFEPRVFYKQLLRQKHTLIKSTTHHNLLYYIYVMIRQHFEIDLNFSCRHRMYYLIILVIRIICLGDPENGAWLKCRAGGRYK